MLEEVAFEVLRISIEEEISFGPLQFAKRPGEQTTGRRIAWAHLGAQLVSGDQPAVSVLAEGSPPIERFER